MKRQAQNRNTFQNHIFYKGHYLETIKNPVNLVMERQKNSTLKMGKNMNRNFTKEDIQMTNIHMKTVQHH